MNGISNDCWRENIFQLKKKLNHNISSNLCESIRELIMQNRWIDKIKNSVFLSVNTFQNGP